MSEPRKEIAAYVAEVSKPGVPWISTSHNILYGLWREYGEPQVTAWLKEHWENNR